MGPFNIKVEPGRETGWVAFDDISVTKTGVPNLVLNPSFEATGNWAPVQTSPGTWLWRNTWGEGGPHTGTYGYAITNNVYGSLTSASITGITAGLEYKVAAWVRGELVDNQGLGGWILRAMFYNGTTFISQVDAASGVGSSLTTTWQQVSQVVTSPAGATSMKIMLYNYNTSGWVAFDDISVSKMNITKYYYANGQR